MGELDGTRTGVSPRKESCFSKDTGQQGLCPHSPAPCHTPGSWCPQSWAQAQPPTQGIPFPSPRAHILHLLSLPSALLTHGVGKMKTHQPQRFQRKAVPENEGVLTEAAGRRAFI